MTPACPARLPPLLHPQDCRLGQGGGWECTASATAAHTCTGREESSGALVGGQKGSAKAMPCSSATTACSPCTYPAARAQQQVATGSPAPAHTLLQGSCTALQPQPIPKPHLRDPLKVRCSLILISASPSPLFFMCTPHHSGTLPRRQV